LNTAPDWLHIVVSAYRARADMRTQTEDGVAIWRVTGGHNNALYRIEADGACYACKLCIPDERQRAAREYEALRLLHVSRVDVAPEPLWLDESCSILPFPAVIYRWLPGAPLTPPLSQGHLEAFLTSYRQLHALQPGDQALDLREAWFHWFAWESYLVDLQALLDAYGAWLAAADPQGPALRDRLARLVKRCTEYVIASGVNPGREAVPLRPCRVDHNLANTVWGPDGRLRWVDWEYSGWGDPALDLSELRWHAAFAELSQAQHRWLRENYCRPENDAAFERRLAVWDHIIVTHWSLLILRRLWTLHNGPDRVRLSQPAAHPAQVRTRLVGFIERAEHFIQSWRAQ
jgi:aminoglycoside phosphotransferase (APT) family kinase protein